jgi:hypothetical protein
VTLISSLELKYANENWYTKAKTKDSNTIDLGEVVCLVTDGVSESGSREKLEQGIIREPARGSRYWRTTQAGR